MVKKLLMGVLVVLCLGACGVSETEADQTLGFRREAGELDDVTEINLENQDITDAGLVHLEGLENLRALWLGGTKISNSGLRRIARLSGLTHLGLQNTGITDRGLSRLAEMKSLRRLWLGNTKVTASGIEQLAGMDVLKWLDIRGLELDGEAFEGLQTLLSPQVFVYHEMRSPQRDASIHDFFENPFDVPLLKPAYGAYTVETTPVFLGEPREIQTRQWPSRTSPNTIDTVYTLKYPGVELVIYHMKQENRQRIINITISDTMFPLKYVDGPGMSREDVLAAFYTPDKITETSLVYNAAGSGEVTFHLRNDVVTRIVCSRPAE